MVNSENTDEALARKLDAANRAAEALARKVRNFFLGLSAIIGIPALLLSLSSIVPFHGKDRYVRTHGKLNDWSIDGPQRGRGWKYRLILSYAYSVNGTEYTGHRITFDPTSYFPYPGRDSAEADLHRYLRAPNISVYYDVKDPSKSVLELRMSDTPWFLFWIGIGACMFGLAVACLTRILARGQFYG